MKYIATLLKIPLACALFLITYGYICAQDTVESESPSIEAILQSTDLLPVDVAAKAHPSANSSDLAYVYQIGANNVGLVRITAENSELNLLQHGNANHAKIELSGKSLVHQTLQHGNGNLFIEYGNMPHLDLRREIVQDGNNQNLIIYGSNSLTQNLKLNVQGDSETITIRNFN